MIRRIVGAIAILVVALIAAAAWLLHAPRPAPATAPVEVQTVEVGGHPRRYLVVTPTPLRADSSVLLVYHPSQSSGADMRRLAGATLERIAQRAHAVVVYPDGHEGHFNDCRRVASFSARRLDVDDVGFSRRIVERLAAQGRIDPSRVYALGVSNGGQMALRLALEAPDLVRGVAAIAANLPTPQNMACQPASTPIRRVVLVEGTRDPINPYGGGRVTLFGFGDRGDVLSAQASAQWFADRLGLSATPPTVLATDPSGMTAHRQDWRSGQGHVRLVSIDGGGHTLPQAGYRAMRLLGATFQSDAVLESTWQLLADNAP
ncbi:MAG TPA: PHB depolymerase family esterase [Albitalea sp.]|uniref:alpha/beta hydrolase family esterase n=1 Tax=Piscinibacter sp. TaxID=1903157 RepID=UPI002ED2BE44